ncbi:MAG: sulfatase-like hydrolase/transferase [Bacillota bacterium]|nr:sulfatase-like hydrolase/transferase [Bacillota bacterium]
MPQLAELKKTKKTIGAKLNAVIFCIFPFLMTILLYQSPEKIANRISASTFSLDATEILMISVTFLLITFLYAFLSALLKKPWISSLVLGALFYTIEVVDIAKYLKLGARITVDDILMFPDVNKIWSFAKKGGGGIDFCKFYFIAAILILAYSFALRFYSVYQPRFMRLNRFAYATVLFAIIFSFSVKSVAQQVFSPQIRAFEDVSSYDADDVAISSIDCLIGSLYSGAEPPNTTIPYNEETMSSIFSKYAPVKSSAVHPDVIVVLSESYFDLNQVNGISLTEDIYKNFKRMKSGGTSGEIVVPAFGGGTASTEYEVMSGTPNKGILNSRSPYRDVGKDSKFWTFANYFEELGYESNYIHPFKSTFYNRKTAFTAGGFDNLIFEDNLTVPIEDYPRDKHISDSTFYHQLEKTLDDKEYGAPQIIFSATMQNHSPYGTISDSDRKIVRLYNENSIKPNQLDAMNAYANGIADTDKALGGFLDYIDHRDRPTVLLYYGDHHPLLDGYEKLNGFTSDQAYDDLDRITTEFAIYTNYSSKLPSPKCSADSKRISAYYLMDVLINYLDLPKTRFVSFLDDAIKHIPVCSMKITVSPDSPEVKSDYEDKLLLLAYDRLLGQGYSFKYSN